LIPIIIVADSVAMITVAMITVCLLVFILEFNFVP
jgi:hypothetical protein